MRLCAEASESAGGRPPRTATSQGSGRNFASARRNLRRNLARLPRAAPQSTGPTRQERLWTRALSPRPGRRRRRLLLLSLSLTLSPPLSAPTSTAFQLSAQHAVCAARHLHAVRARRRHHPAQVRAVHSPPSLDLAHRAHGSMDVDQLYIFTGIVSSWRRSPATGRRRARSSSAPGCPTLCTSSARSLARLAPVLTHSNPQHASVLLGAGDRRRTPHL